MIRFEQLRVRNENMNDKKKKAIKLRKEGKSYSEINNELAIPKSTLSYWLREIEIDKKFKKRLEKLSKRAGSLALIRRNKLQTQKAKERATKILKESSKEIANIDLEKLKLIGTALYFGEGGKSANRVDFTNSNPEMIKIIMKFFRKVCKAKEEKFRAQLSIYDKEKISESIKYWTRITGIPPAQFIKVNISISKYSKKRRINKLPFGTIQIRIADVNLFHKISGWINGSIQKIDNMPG